jgi:2-methylcitrate dehydratase PrpD
VPVALAIAEAMGGIEGKSLITAIALGAEIVCRMRLVPDQCIGISGWTGEIYGAFGAAVTAGRIGGLSGDEMGHALGLAYSQAAGNAQTIYDGALGTRLQQGFSARAGCVSVAMAKAGLTGAKNFLEGQAGLYPVYYRGLGYDINRLTEGLGEKYEILNIATKPYPCCGFIMAPIENVLRIMEGNRLVAGDIKKAVFGVNQKMFNTVCFPPDTKYQPQTPADAMFSLPYVVATAIKTGDVLLSDFSHEAIGNPERLKIARKVEIEIDKGIEKESQALNLSLSLHQVDLETEGGQRFSRKLYHAKGFPQSPMTMKDFTEKAKRCVPYAVKPFPESKVEELKELLVHLEDKEDIRPLTKLLF